MARGLPRIDWRAYVAGEGIVYVERKTASAAIKPKLEPVIRPKAVVTPKLVKSPNPSTDKQSFSDEQKTALAIFCSVLAYVVLLILFTEAVLLFSGLIFIFVCLSHA